jgi:hypothetical protein
VKRGRMYANVDALGGAGAGGLGGGNHVASECRTKSSLTCRCAVRSALAPTM